MIRARGSENHVETLSFEENIDLVTLQPWSAPAQQVAQEDVEFDLGLLPQAEAGSTHEEESAAAERTWTNLEAPDPGTHHRSGTAENISETSLRNTTPSLEEFLRNEKQGMYFIRISSQ